MQTVFSRLDSLSKEQRFYMLLAAILVYLLFEFLRTPLGEADFIRVTLSSLLLLAAIDCLRFKKNSLMSSRWFGVLVIALGWVNAATDVGWLSTVDFLFRIVFFLIVTAALIHQVAKTERASLSVIVGAIDGYLLLGIIGGALALVVESVSPGAFGFAPKIYSGTSRYFYYSYITLATVGYGDVTPTVPAAQLLSVALGVAGQLYIATIIAVLVGKYLSRKPAKD
jgi:voltage-gated potassium channel